MLMAEMGCRVESSRCSHRALWTLAARASSGGSIVQLWRWLRSGSRWAPRSASFELEIQTVTLADAALVKAQQWLRQSAPYRASTRLRLPSRWGAVGGKAPVGHLATSVVVPNFGLARSQTKTQQAPPEASPRSRRRIGTYPLHWCQERIHHNHYPSISACSPHTSPDPALLRSSFHACPHTVTSVHSPWLLKRLDSCLS